MRKSLQLARAALFFAGLMVFAGPTLASFAGHLRCVSPEVAVAIIQRNHPTAVAHVMSAGEFAAFADGIGLTDGDAAIWFERPGAAVVYVMVFVQRCRVGSGQISRERLMTLMGGATV